MWRVSLGLAEVTRDGLGDLGQCADVAHSGAGACIRPALWPWAALGGTLRPGEMVGIAALGSPASPVY